MTFWISSSVEVVCEVSVLRYGVKASLDANCEASCISHQSDGVEMFSKREMGSGSLDCCAVRRDPCRTRWEMLSMRFIAVNQGYPYVEIFIREWSCKLD
jgi:hypothetical protein